MNTQLICFMGILALLMAVTVSVPAQENGLALDATLNNTTMNNTTLEFAASSIDLNDAVAENISGENVSQENVTLENVTPEAITEPVSEAIAPESASPKAETSSAAGDVLYLGSGLRSDRVFVVNGNAPQKSTFEVGIPIKSCRDVGKMVFVCDIV
jgi:hypothetical protein